MTESGPIMDDLPGVTPEDVRDNRDAVLEKFPDDEMPPSMLSMLLTPAKRFEILDTLLEAGEEALTVSEMSERGDVTSSSFNRHKDMLLDLGVIVEAGKRGNAQMYRVNINHPAIQILMDLQDVMIHGGTVQYLHDRFIDKSLVEKIKTIQQEADAPLTQETIAERLREEYGLETATAETIDFLFE